MKGLTKSLIVASIVGTIGLGGVATAGAVSADSTTASTDPMSSLVDKIASTFNIDRTKVQEVFTADRTEREAAREKEQTARLQALVDNGTITATQKSAIEAKMTAMKTEREAEKEDWKTLTDEERKSKMDEKKTELESWAKEQGLDLTKLKGVLGGGPGGHGGSGL